MTPQVAPDTPCINAFAWQVPCWSREVLQDVLSDALSQPWTAEQEAVLGNELGMESVIDAVGRVNSLAKVLPAAQPVLFGFAWLCER